MRFDFDLILSSTNQSINQSINQSRLSAVRFRDFSTNVVLARLARLQRARNLLVFRDFFSCIFEFIYTKFRNHTENTYLYKDENSNPDLEIGVAIHFVAPPLVPRCTFLIGCLAFCVFRHPGTRISFCILRATRGGASHPNSVVAV